MCAADDAAGRISTQTTQQVHARTFLLHRKRADGSTAAVQLRSKAAPDRKRRERGTFARNYHRGDKRFTSSPSSQLWLSS